MDNSSKEFIKHYLETALWSSCDYREDQDTPLDDNYYIEDIDLDTLKAAIKDCLSFIAQAEKLELICDEDYSTVGHDFWLTRNGHGAGFWDGDYPEHGDKLTELSESFGGIDLHVTDDNKIAS